MTINTMDTRITELFTDLVDWSRRAEGEKDFFINLLKRNGCEKVFDACTGDGYDSIRLLQAGFQVMGNDLDSLFRKMAQKNAFQRNLSLDIRNYDWRTIPQDLTEKFDAVICLGNSLTYLLDKKDRQRAVDNFARIVRKEGIVIIDQRNYDYMLDERINILQDPEKNFRYSAKFYYCSSTNRIIPTLIEEERVVLSYYKDHKKLEGVELEVYPLRKLELKELMKNAGLQVKVYGDFEEEKTEEVDFYQQVGIKL